MNGFKVLIEKEGHLKAVRSISYHFKTFPKEKTSLDISCPQLT
jgi:hypothetical protein